MGNSPLTVCIHQAWEKQTVQVVLPDGQVLFMPHPLTVSMLLEAHPFHFVCQGSPSLLEQRLPGDAKLESGEIYYLLPVPRPVFPAVGSFHRRSTRPKSRKLVEKVTYRPPPSYVLDKAPSSKVTDYTQLNWKPQGCLINFFVFRHNVASIMPEENLKLSSGVHTHGPRQLSRRHQRFESRSRSVRGRKQVITWTPHLESISETKTFQDFAKKNVNSFSVSLFSSVKTFSTSPPRSPPNPGQLGARPVLMHVPLQVERETQKQKLIYSA